MTIDHQQQVLQLFVRHQARIKGFIVSLMGDFAAAEDVLQETFLVVQQKAGSFEMGSNFLAWSFQIARFQVMKAQARHNRTAERFSSETLEALAASAPLEPFNEATLAVLPGCLEKLAPQARRIVDLFYQPELEARLLNSAADRARFWDRAETHVLLHEGLQRNPAVVPAGLHRAMWRRVAWWAAAAAAVIVALFVLSPRRASEPVASLSAATNARWSDPNVELTLRGGELPVGPLRLESGVAEFSFARGATALIEGPAVFEVVAADRLVLRAGRVIGRCAKPEAKLAIVTPGAVVTDLGTEFGVAVGDDRQTCVAVIKGAVELGAGQHPRRLNAGEAMAVDERGQMAKAEFVIAEFSRMAKVFPAEEVSVRNGINRLQDPGMTSKLWNETAGHVDRAAAGAARIRAKGNPLWPLIWQDVPAREIAGRAVVASVQAMQPDDDPLSGLQNAIIKMMFLDEAGHEFARAERHFLRSSAPRDQWIRGQIAAIAPSGTVRVQFQMLLNARGLKTGSLLFSDPSLVVMDAQ